jgi:biopolymer transport protein ExbB
MELTMKPFLSSLIIASLFNLSSLHADEDSLEPFEIEKTLAMEEEELPIITFSQEEEEALFEPLQKEEEILSLPKTLDLEETIVTEEHPPLPLIEKAEEVVPAPPLSSPAKLITLDQPKEPTSLVANKASIIEAKKETPFTFKIDFHQVFAGSPIIYSVLITLSMLALFIWLYSLIHLRLLGDLPEAVMKNLRSKLTSNQYEDALTLCLQNESLFCKMLASGIAHRKHGLQLMLETMRTEGKRASAKFWQRIALLNDIAIIAPMLGLLGTVLGMFYAFYDVNRSVESVSALFDGLGISVGTTVAGLLVAIIAMIFYSLARYRLVRRLALVENEVHQFSVLIDHKNSLSSEENR